jgi:60 kDa SS-A/Ro ribonucleoprotein
MANKALFSSTRGALLPATDTVNRHGVGAYDYSPRHKLAQYAVTGCLSNTFYAAADEQLTTVLELIPELDGEFVAKCAVYARRTGMKDVPALLLASLSITSVQHFKKVFGRVVDNGRMLRNFVQILRSGVVGRKSLGTAPKALIQRWLNEVPERKLIEASVGTAPSLQDIVRMVHPTPKDQTREAFYGWLLGKPVVPRRAAGASRDSLRSAPVAAERLPAAVQSYIRYQSDRSQELPDVPFQMLTALGLKQEEWARVALRGGWQMVRMNLNTFARHGVFALDGLAERIAAKLVDREAIERARVFPFQLMAAYQSLHRTVPAVIREALQDAMEIAIENVPSFGPSVAVCPDVSGSMSSPVTGARRGATSVIRCVDVAALMTAAVVRKNKQAIVLPFEVGVRDVDLSARDSVMTNARKLASIRGGGTNCAAPLEWLKERNLCPDLVILVSDNQSWVNARANGPTQLMRVWEEMKTRNHGAKLVCIDLQANGTTQAAERSDVLNVGGFSDEVFEIVARFTRGELGTGHWMECIEAVEL